MEFRRVLFRSGYLPARSRPRYHADPDGGGATGQTRPDAARGRPPQGRTAEDRDPADSVAAEPLIPVLLRKQEPRATSADARDSGLGNTKHLTPPRTSPAPTPRSAARHVGTEAASTGSNRG